MPPPSPPDLPPGGSLRVWVPGARVTSLVAIAGQPSMAVTCFSHGAWIPLSSRPSFPSSAGPSPTFCYVPLCPLPPQSYRASAATTAGLSFASPSAGPLGSLGASFILHFAK